MKYLSKIWVIAAIALGFAACSDGLEDIAPDHQQQGDIPVNVTFSFADRAMQTRSKVSGTERVVHTMQLVCFDANGQYLGIRNAGVTSNGASGTFFDTGTISGTVPQGTSRIHFIANRNLSVPLSFSNGTSESEVMLSEELSTLYNIIGEGDDAHQEICYWGYHKEGNAETMSNWLNPLAGTSNTVYMIRDRAKIVLSYNPDNATTPVTKIEWLIHNGRERGYIAPVQAAWGNTSYWGNSTYNGNTYLLSTAGMNEYTTCGRYSLWRSAENNDSTLFDVAYQSSGTYEAKAQFLFDDNNEAIDDVKVILRVTYIVSGSPKIVYHVLKLNKRDPEHPDDLSKAQLYDIVRNNTYYINAKQLSPDIAFYKTLKDAVDGNEFVNADVEVDRTIPDINNNQYTLQIKLPTETTSIVFNTVDEHTMDFVFRYVNDINTTASINPEDFTVTWEKDQDFCSTSLPVTYNPVTKQFTITATVSEGKVTNQLQHEWIKVTHNASGLTRYIHVYVIDQFKFEEYPKLTKVDNGYKLSFKIPKPEYDDPDNPGTSEKVYPTTLYPIDVKFTTNTLNAYGIENGVTNYGLFGVSIEGTSQLCTQSNFETDYNNPYSSTSTSDMTHWYFQQEDNYWDFWYTYSIKNYEQTNDGVVNIYFKDVTDHISYADVNEVGLFMYINYFGKYYSVPVTQ